MKKAQKKLYSTLTSARHAAYTLLGSIDRTFLKKNNQIIILSYHSVANDDWRFSVDVKTLQQQIIYLQKHFQIITLKTVQKYIDGNIDINKPSAVITFDDGYKDILTMKDFFRKKNITPALFVLANSKTPNWKELGGPNAKRSFLSKRDIISLHKSGWEIGCHSATHANLSLLSDTELKDEIVSAKKTLENHLGIKISYFAYPRGKYNAKVLQFVKKAKFSMALTMDDGFIKPTANPLTIPRIGIDRTHTFKEFTSTFSPSVVRLRKVVKESPIGRYL